MAPTQKLNWQEQGNGALTQISAPALKLAPQNGRTEKGREGERERETDTQVYGSLASGVLPRGLEATRLLLEVQMV